MMLAGAIKRKHKYLITSEKMEEKNMTTNSTAKPVMCFVEKGHLTFT